MKNFPPQCSSSRSHRPRRPGSVALVSGTALALIAFSGCAKDDTAPKVESPAAAIEPAPAAPVQEPVPAPAPVDTEAQAKQQKVDDAIAKLEEDSKTEQARWTPELETATQRLVDTKFAKPKKAIAAAIAGAHRVPGNSDRDAYRHPLETLSFMGLKPTSRVAEMGVGAGWYTEILAPVVAARGLLITGSADPEGPKDEMSTVYGLRHRAFINKSEALYGKVQTFVMGGEAQPKIAEPGSVDLVLAMREMHNWQRRGTMDANLAAIVEALAPGGRFGVVQHRAKADAKVEDSAEKGYLPEQWLIEKVQSAGLELVAKSEINANPKDTKDYAEGVWALPPNLRTDDANKEKYQAIGESDRMTLLFKKSK